MESVGKRGGTEAAGGSEDASPLSGERRIATPRSDLSIVRKGGSLVSRQRKKSEDAPEMMARMVTAILKPGFDRRSIFRSSKGKRVYAYSVYPSDLTKFVREDEHGVKTVGRLVNGRFQVLRKKA